MKWIEKGPDLDRNLVDKFEDLVNNIESTWNLLTVKAINIDGVDYPKIAIGNAGYIDIQPTNHGAEKVAIVLAVRNYARKIANPEMAFCKLDLSYKDALSKKYNSLYIRGVNIIYRIINTALTNAYQSAKE